MTQPALGALTESDKERIRYHTGYIETSFAASLQFGIPRPVETIFLLETSMSLLVNAAAINRVHHILNTLDEIEKRLKNSLCVLVAEKIGDLTLRGAMRGQTYPDLLEREYVRWAKRLADILGVPLYPYSDRFRGHGPGNSVPITRV